MATLQEVLLKWASAVTPLQKLQIIAFILAESDSRLASVLQGIGGQPDQPTTAVLQQIRMTASTIVTRVDQALPAPPPTPTPPPSDL